MKTKNNKILIGLILLILTTIVLLPGQKLSVLITRGIYKMQESTDYHIKELTKGREYHGSN